MNIAQPYHNDLLITLYQQRDWCIRTLRKKTGCSREDAEDIFIEAVLILERKQQDGKLESLDNLNTYLMGVCQMCSKRSYFNTQKQKSAKRDVEQYFYEYLQEVSLPVESELSGKEELLMAVEFSLSSLGKKCRQLIELFYYEQKDLTAIARLLGYSDHRAAAVTKFRCFKSLKNKAISLKTQFEKEN